MSRGATAVLLANGIRFYLTALGGYMSVTDGQTITSVTIADTGQPCFLPPPRWVDDITRLADHPHSILMMWPAIQNHLSTTMSCNLRTQSTLTPRCWTCDLCMWHRQSIRASTAGKRLLLYMLLMHINTLFHLYMNTSDNCKLLRGLFI